MADHRPYADSDDEGADGLGAGPDPRTNVNTPRWVKVFGAIVLAVVLLVVILFLAGRDHGPGRHISSPRVTAPDALLTLALGLPEDGMSPS